MKVLITRPRLQADAFAQALAQAGFEPVFFAVIEICPYAENPALARAIEKLHSYDWIVFTSVNGVEVFCEALRRASQVAQGQAGNARPRIAAIGPKTAEALQRHCMPPNFVPQEYIAEAILPGLGELRGRRVLLPRAETARKALPAAITAAGGEVDEIAVYRTVPAVPTPEALAALKSGVGVITFTSPSTVENFVLLVQAAGLDPLHLPGRPKTACIGPITGQTALQMGFKNVILAEDYTTAGLVRLLSRAVQEEK